jgi:hypothetical protein
VCFELMRARAASFWLSLYCLALSEWREDILLAPSDATYGLRPITVPLRDGRRNSILLYYYPKAWSRG